MPYVYQLEKPNLFTDGGIRDVLKIHHEAQRLLGIAGAFRMIEVCRVVTGDVWFQLAALDYLVELGHIREVTDPNVWGQDRVFVGPKK